MRSIAIDTATLHERIRTHDQWYHTLDLGPGLVTPGWYDLRGLPDRIPFPSDLTGQRCLDVGTFDGFWAFTMEQRGATEVLATDLLDHDRWDWPAVRSASVVGALADRKKAGEGFLLAHEALDSIVEREELSVYDLSPDRVGTFDFVYVGSLLLHLRDPVRALEAVRSVTKGEVLVVDAIHLPNTLRSPRQPVATLHGVGRPWWWHPNRAGLLRLVESAGYELSGTPQVVFMPPGAGQHRLTLRQSVRAFRHPEGRAVAFRSRFGEPHLAVPARPVR